MILAPSLSFHMYQIGLKLLKSQQLNFQLTVIYNFIFYFLECICTLFESFNVIQTLYMFFFGRGKLLAMHVLFFGRGGKLLAIQNPIIQLV